MSVQDEVAWLLGVIKDEYPAAWPENTVRINRDEPEILETGERTNSVDLQRYNAIGVSSGSVQRDLYGTEIQYRVNTTLDVRIEAQTAGNWGEQTGVDKFNGLVKRVQHAINSVIKYPDVDPDAEDIGYVTYLDARIEDEQRLSAGDKDYYRTDFTVRMRGNAQTP